MKKNNEYKIAVMGAGAVGSIIGAFLALNGRNVTLIGRKEHMDAVKRNGLHVDGIKGTFNVKLHTATRLDFSPDIIFVTAKSQNIDEIFSEIRLKAAGKTVVLFQNGIYSSRRAASFFKRENIINAVVLFNARYLSPGKVSLGTSSPILLESRTENPLFGEISEMLNLAAETKIVNNITEAQWSKLFVNAFANSLDAVSGMPVEKYRNHPVILKTGILILREIFRITDSMKIRPAVIPGFNPFRFRLLCSLPLFAGAYILGRKINPGKDPEIITSMYQSLIRGKKTEVDFITGEIIAAGEKTGVPTPVNCKIRDMIHEIEKTGRHYTVQEIQRMIFNRNT